MRMFSKLLIALLALTLAPAAASAQASFLFGVVVGSALSSGTASSSEVSPNVIYSMPRVAERVREPLAIRIVASDCFRNSDSRNGKSVMEYFIGSVRDWAEYEILQAVRTTAADNTGCVRIFFAFIEKSKVRPLENLPQVQK